MTFVDVDLLGDRLHPGPGAAVVVLAAFLVAFLAIRTSAAETGSRSCASFDAAVCSFAFAGLVVAGARPFGLDDPTSVWATALVAAAVLTLSGVCFAKGRIVLGVIGLFIPLVALVAAVRLARPRSVWARGRYAPAKLARAERRFAATRPQARVHRRLGDLVAGVPSPDPNHEGARS